MANLDNLIAVTLSIADTAVTEVDFGTPLIYANTPKTETVLAYSNLAALAADGFSVTSPAYLIAETIFAQSPRVKQLKVGKRNAQFTQTVRLTPTVTSVIARSGPETLAETNFATNALWTAAGDFAFAGGKAVFTYATGAGTLTQTLANLVTAPTASRQYKFTYTVSGAAATHAATITTSFADVATSLNVTDGTHTVYFESAAVPGDFVISGTAGVGGAFSLDDMSLKLMAQVDFGFQIDGTDIAYVQDQGDILADVATGLASAINAAALGVTAVSSGTYVTVTSGDGEVHTYSGFSIPTTATNVSASDLTVNPGIATDLNAIQLYDSDWYALVLDSNDTAQVVAAAAWVEANKKLGFFDVSGSGIFDPASTTDALYLLDASGYNRSIAVVRKTIGDYAAAGWAGVGLAYKPGSITWAHKQLAGVSTEQYNDTDINTIIAKHGNYYTERFGVGDIMEGWASSGRFIDITHGSDNLVSDIQVSLYQLLTSSLKIPYTDAGITLVQGKILEVLNDFVQSNFLAELPRPAVTVPKAADVATNDKANRILKNVVATATLAGAIHRIEIALELSL